MQLSRSPAQRSALRRTAGPYIVAHGGHLRCRSETATCLGPADLRRRYGEFPLVTDTGLFHNRDFAWQRCRDQRDRTLGEVLVPSIQCAALRPWLGAGGDLGWKREDDVKSSGLVVEKTLDP